MIPLGSTDLYRNGSLWALVCWAWVSWAEGVFRGRRIIVDAAKGRGSPALFFAGDHGKAGIWVTEERNVYEDYRARFGEDPSAIGAVALMTDTDNTGGEAEAYYGDIFLGAAR